MLPLGKYTYIQKYRDKIQTQTDRETVLMLFFPQIKNSGREVSEQRVESAPGTPVNKPMFIV